MGHGVSVYSIFLLILVILKMAKNFYVFLILGRRNIAFGIGNINHTVRLIQYVYWRALFTVIVNDDNCIINCDHVIG